MPRASNVYVAKRVPEGTILLTSTVKYEMTYWLESLSVNESMGVWIVRTRDGRPCDETNSRVFTVGEFLQDD